MRCRAGAPSDSSRSSPDARHERAEQFPLPLTPIDDVHDQQRSEAASRVLHDDHLAHAVIDWPLGRGRVRRLAGVSVPIKRIDENLRSELDEVDKVTGTHRCALIPPAPGNRGTVLLMAVDKSIVRPTEETRGDRRP
jgi:hypothetical protein